MSRPKVCTLKGIKLLKQFQNSRTSRRTVTVFKIDKNMVKMEQKMDVWVHIKLGNKKVLFLDLNGVDFGYFENKFGSNSRLE